MNTVDDVYQRRIRLTFFISLVLLTLTFVVSVATGYISLNPIQLGRTILGYGIS
jgi:iron complex transport system permease protein